MDPTETFQTRPACDGPVRLRVRRYACRRCGADAPSRFLFDGKVFDPAYFRRKMAESRERRRRLKQERSRQARIPHERAPAAAALAALIAGALALAVSGAVVFSPAHDPRAAYDQDQFHRVAIERFAADWPAVDLGDDASATTPAYHLVMAAAGANRR